jgi:hypothetical protein
MIINNVLIFELPVGDIPRPLEHGSAAIVSRAEFASPKKSFPARQQQTLFYRMSFSNGPLRASS